MIVAGVGSGALAGTAAASGTSTDVDIEVTSSESTVGANGETTLTVEITNYGEETTYTIEPTTVPDGWSVSDEQGWDFNNYKQITVGTGETKSVTFTASAGESSGSFLVTFGVWYDSAWNLNAKDGWVGSGSTGVNVDADGPSISNLRASFDGNIVTVKAEVTDWYAGVDPSTVDVNYVTGWWSSITGGTTISMTHESGDTYSATFELDWGEKFSYKVLADDQLGNSNTGGPKQDQVPTNHPPSINDFTLSPTDDRKITVDAWVSDDTRKVDTVEVEWKGAGDWFFSNSAEMNHVSGNHYRVTIPGGKFDWGESVAVRIKATDDTGKSQTSASKSATVPDDTTPPSISDIDVSYSGKQVTVTADVSDNRAGVDNVKINYKTGGIWDTIIGGTTISMDRVSGSTYRATFEVDYGTEFSYEITATDRNANSRSSGPYDGFVPRGTAEFRITNEDDEAKTVAVFVDGSKEGSITVPAGDTESTTVEVDPVAHTFEIEYDEQDRDGQTYTKSKTATVPQLGNKRVSFTIPKRQAPILEVTCTQCDLGTYERENPPTVRVDVENIAGGDMTWEVATNLDVVEKTDSYVLVRPSTAEAGAFERDVTITVMDDRIDGERYQTVTVTGTATVEPTPPSVSFSHYVSQGRVGDTMPAAVLGRSGKPGTPDQPAPAAAENLTYVWYLDGTEFARTEGATAQDIGARATQEFTVDEPGEHTLQVTVEDPNTGLTNATETVTFTAGKVDGRIVGYQTVFPDTYELNTWYDVTVAVENTGDLPHTFEVRAHEPSGTVVNESHKTISLEPGETGTVTFEQQWYGVYTDTRGFVHDLYIDSQTGREPAKIDRANVTLDRPPAGDLTLEFTDGAGNPLDASFELRNDEGKVIRDGFGDSIYRNIPAGEYTLIAHEPDHVSREKSFTLQAGEDKTIRMSLPNEDVDAEIVDETFTVVDRQSSYAAGDVVRATVEVENTGNTDFEFFVGYSARDEFGRTYSNNGQTGQFVKLSAGEQRTVTFEWQVPSHAFNGSYDLISAVWYDYPETGEVALDRSSWLPETIEVKQVGGRKPSDGVVDAIERYREGTEPSVGVLPRMTVDDRTYRIAVYMGPDTPFEWTGVKEDSLIFEAFKDQRQPGQPSGWEQLDVTKALVFRETGDGYYLVTNPDIVYEVAQQAAPGMKPFDPTWRSRYPEKSGFLGEHDYNDGYDPSDAKVEHVNDIVESKILQSAGQWDTWMESESDRYYTAVKAMTSTKTASVLSPELRERLTDANTLNGAIKNAATLQETVEGREKRVVETYLRLLYRYQGEVQDADVEKLQKVNKGTESLGHVLDFILTMSEWKVYSDRRVEMLETILAYDDAHDDVTLDPALRAAMQRVIAEHENVNKQLMNKFVDFLIDKAVDEGGKWALKKGGHVALMKFTEYLVAKGVIGAASGATLSSAIAGIGGQVLAGLAISDLLYNVDGIYGSAAKAKYAYLAAEEFDAVADHIRARHYGTGIDDSVTSQYRAADAMKKHALGTFWISHSQILASTWVDDAKADMYDVFGESHNLDTRQEYQLERGQDAHNLSEWLYFPESLNRTVESIPEDVEVQRPVAVVDTSADVGEVTDGDVQTMTIANDGTMNLDIKSLVTSSDGITATVNSSMVQPGETTTLTLEFDTDSLNHTFAETVYVHTNAPTSPTRIHIDGEVIDAHTGTVRVESDPSGANVSIDGTQVGRTPITKELPVGEHHLLVERSGFEPVSRSVTITQDETTMESVSLPAKTDLSLTATGGTTDVGDRVTIEFEVTNQGVTATNGVDLDLDSLPADWTIVDTGGAGTWDSEARKWVIETIPAGEHVKTTLALQIPTTDPGGSYGITASLPSGSTSESATAPVTTNSNVSRLAADLETNRTVAPIDGAVWLDATASEGIKGDNVSIDWAVIDGPATAVSALPNAQAGSVMISEPGSYTFQVTLSNGDQTDTASRTITVQENEAPVASLRANRTVVDQHEAVELDATESTDADGTVATYQWDVDGDGVVDETTEAPVLVHSFESAGTKHAKVTVRDNLGGTSTATQSVEVRDVTPPSPAITLFDEEESEISGPVPLETLIRLDASTSSDNVGVETYSWHVSGASPSTTEGEIATVRFEKRGEQTITLAVEDAAGNVNKTTRTVSVVDRDAPTIELITPQATAQISPETVITVRVSDRSLADGTVNISGSDGVETQTIHPEGTTLELNRTFATEGDATITVEATDGDDNTAVETFEFEIVDPPTIDSVNLNEGESVNASDELVVTYADNHSGVNASAVRLLANGTVVKQGGTASELRATIENLDLPDGSVELTVVVEDEVGYTSSHTVNVTVDASRPDVLLSESQSSRVSSHHPTHLTASLPDDDVETATLVIRDGTDALVLERELTPEANEVASVRWDATDGDGNEVPSGDYEVVVTATDAAGNTGTNTTTLTVDNDPPTVTVDTLENATGVTDASTDATVYTNGTLIANGTADGTPGSASAVFATVEATFANFRHGLLADRLGTTNEEWTAPFDLSELPDDGHYRVNVTAVDPAANTNHSTTPATVVLDRTAPDLAVTIEPKNATAAWVNVTSSEPIEGEPMVKVETPADDMVSPVLQQTGDGWAGTVPVDENGEYEVTATSVDRAGNRDTDSATAVINTSLSTDEKRVTIVNKRSGTMIEIRTENDVASAFGSVTETTVPLGNLSANLSGARFLNAEFSENLDANITNATIAMPVNKSAIPSDLTKEDVSIKWFDSANDSWVALNETTVETRVGPDGTEREYWVTTVPHFSTYGAVASDETAPTLTTQPTPIDGAQLNYEQSNATIQFEYEDSVTAVNASAVTFELDDTVVTDHAGTQITSTSATHNATELTPGDHTASVIVVDEAGNERIYETNFTIPVDTEPPEIVSTTPANDTTMPADTSSLELVVEYADGETGIDEESVTLSFVDHSNVSAQLISRNSTHAVYDVTGLRNDMEYAYTVAVSDSSLTPNTTAKVFSFDVAAPTSSEGDDGDGGGGGGGGSPPPPPILTDLAPLSDGGVELTIQNGRTGQTAKQYFDGIEAGDVTFDRLRVTYAQDLREFTVALHPSETPPGDISSIEGVETLGYLDAERAVQNGYFESVALRFEVAKGALPEGATLDDVALYRYDGGEWTQLETSHSGTTFEAAADGFATYAVRVELETTEESTAKTPSDASTSTEASEDSESGPTDTVQPDDGQAGFGLVLPLVVLVLVLLGRRWW